jgi:phage tail sheath protein FI
VLEDSGDLADQNAAVNWSQFSQYVRITLGATALNPALLAAAALSAGTDDRTNIVDAQWATALALFTADLGPGQVSGPGRTTDVGHTQLTAHALANNRVAIMDGPNTSTVATLQASAVASRSRFGAMFAPWVVIPGIVIGSTRTVPPCALVAGLIARNDPSLGTNRPSAGNAGVALFASDLSQLGWDDASRQTLNSSGVNVIRDIFGQIRVYGWRSTVDGNADPSWIDFGNSRLYMLLATELDQVGENFVFEEIDGQNGKTIAAFHDALAGVLLEHFTTGELFGSTANEAFLVDTGPVVNSLVNIANLELHADCHVKMSPFAEYVPIRVIKRQVTEAI